MVNATNVQYLTQEYIENILKKYFKNPSMQVIEIIASPANAKGESYCSVMTRLHVKYKVNEEDSTLEEIIFLVKASYEDNPFVTNILLKYNVYNTEMHMYETVFPQLHQLLQEINDEDRLCAKTIYVDRELKAIMCEDLSEKNFATADRLKGMDETHVKLCLKKLAKMHATAAVLNERQAGALEKFTYGFFNRHVNCYGIFFENVLNVCAKFAENCPELGAYYGDKLIKLIPYATEYATRCYDPNPKHFLTLNHGDFWTNNVMLQYLNTTVRDALLIDFQFCNWASPAIDLFYFLSTSLQDDLLLNQQAKLVQFYHEILVATLNKLKYKQHIPTLNELHEQLKERAFYAVTSQLAYFPLIANDKTDDADFESLVKSDEKAQRFHNVLYTNERVKRIIKEMLPRFDKMGLLDIVD